MSIKDMSLKSGANGAGKAIGSTSATRNTTVGSSQNMCPSPSSHISDDSFEDPPLAEEHPAVGPPISVICPASMPSACPGSSSAAQDRQFGRPRRPAVAQGLSRENRAPSGTEAPL